MLPHSASFRALAVSSTQDDLFIVGRFPHQRIYGKPFWCSAAAGLSRIRWPLLASCRINYRQPPRKRAPWGHGPLLQGL